MKFVSELMWGKRLKLLFLLVILFVFTSVIPVTQAQSVGVDVNTYLAYRMDSSYTTNSYVVNKLVSDSNHQGINVFYYHIYDVQDLFVSYNRINETGDFLSQWHSSLNGFGNLIVFNNWTYWDLLIDANYNWFAGSLRKQYMTYINGSFLNTDFHYGLEQFYTYEKDGTTATYQVGIIYDKPTGTVSQYYEYVRNSTIQDYFNYTIEYYQNTFSEVPVPLESDESVVLTGDIPAIDLYFPVVSLLSFPILVWLKKLRK